MRAMCWSCRLALWTMVAACGDSPALPDAQPPAPPDAAPDGAPPCPAATGPTMHTTGAVNADETWTAAGRPHIVTVDTTIYATLTLEPCAEVQVAGLRTLLVRGALVGEGTAERPIRIAARDASAPFAQIRTAPGGTIRLAHTTVEDGGDPLNRVPDLAGTFDVQGADNTRPALPTIFVDHVTVRRSRSNGMVLYDSGGFAPGSTDLAITGAAGFPLNVTARSVGTIPTGAYTGNGVDEILIPAGGDTVAETATMRALGVPYRIGRDGMIGTFRVGRPTGATGLATLTIEPGVTLRFQRGSIFEVEHFINPFPATGALIAVGTADRPIVFTSAAATPAAGDWRGLSFGLIPDPTNRIQHARVEFAGQITGSGSDACSTDGTNGGAIVSAAIRILGPPSGVFITDTAIVASQRHGIDRGWRTDQPEAFDFLASNTFTDVGGCRQTFPRASRGECPVPVPCP